MRIKSGMSMAATIAVITATKMSWGGGFLIRQYQR
jgi:hypothetical protein